MKRALIAAIVLLAIILGGFLILSNSNADMTGNDVVGNEDGNGVKTFQLTGENFKFVMNGVTNPDLIVQEGDTVRIEFESVEGFHDWVMNEFNVATNRVFDTDGITYVEFVADEKGTFEYYCSVGEHQANGMWGNLIVE